MALLDCPEVSCDRVAEPSGHEAAELSADTAGYEWIRLGPDAFPLSDSELAVPISYWTKGESRVNFGDALSELFVARLFCEPRAPADVYHVVGSVIAPWMLGAHRSQGPVERIAYWGCGMRDSQAMPQADLEASLFYGVRGPLTRKLLNAPVETPLCDPGFLLPLLSPVPPGSPRTGRVIAPHILEIGRAEELRRAAGADAIVSVSVSPTIEALDNVIQLLANAEFVLAGSLHAAVVAAAYDVPFAFYESGFIDIPFKWRDLAASLDIAPAWARSIEEGEDLYGSLIERRIVKPKLAPLLDVCPFAIRASISAAAMLYDEGVPAVEALRRAAGLGNLPGEQWEARRARMLARNTFPLRPPTEGVKPTPDIDPSP